MNSQERLLVVDDEPIVCQSCARILERQGFHVETCTDPREGLRLAVSRSWGAILLDILMPELSGTEFLKRLRSTDPDVPVIVITGHGSVPNAAEAMRLRASDYLPKPFTPEEITDAVSRVIPLSKRGKTIERENPRAVPTGDIRFLDRGWVSLEADGTALVGGFLTREDGQSIVRVTVAQPGELVVAGLPIAHVRLVGGRSRTVPTPLSGEVLERNAAMTSDPGGAWADPCRAGWMARIRPTQLEEELPRTTVRRVVLASADKGRARVDAGLLARLGCSVEVVATAAGAVSALRAQPGGIVVLDGEAAGAAGPGFVREVHEAVPEAKVIVTAERDAAARGEYVASRILYYALSPYTDYEIIDILDTAFRTAERSTHRPPRGPMPHEVRRIQTTDGRGREASIVPPAGLLREDEGLGAAIIRRLSESSRPLQVTLGARPHTRQDLARVAGLCGLLVLVSVGDLGRIPGSVEVDRCAAPSDDWFADGVRVVRVRVQANEGEDAARFDDVTTDAIARIVVDAATE